MYYFWVDNILFSLQYMTIQKFLIPDGIEYYDNNQALLFENIRSSVLNIFKRYKYKLVITPINSMWKDRAFLRQYYENISFDGQQGTSQDHMAHTQKQGSAGLTLDAQAGQNLGLLILL